MRTEMKGYQEERLTKKKNCMKAQKKAYTGPCPLDRLLVQEEEERVFLIGHPLGPNK